MAALITITQGISLCIMIIATLLFTSQDESIVRNAHDGVWNGVRYYDCQQNRGSFVPLKDLKPCNEGKRKCSAGTYVHIHVFTLLK